MTTLGLGCASIGNLFAPVSEEDAAATVDAAWDAGIRYFDTAPLYGHGLSERRLGAALAHRPRSDYLLATKVGRLLVPTGGRAEPTMFHGVDDVRPIPDYSRDGVLRSVEASLERLGVDRLDVVMVHDPDDHEQQATAKALPALIELRDQRVIGQVGCGMNQSSMLIRFVERVDLDMVLLAGRYTLLDRSGADVLLPLCLERGVDVVLGGVFNSGVLVDPDLQPTYDYAPADHEVLARARRMRDICARYGLPLAAAAIQFGARHPAVTRVLIGARNPRELDLDLAWMGARVPDDVWEELDAA